MNDTYLFAADFRAIGLTTAALVTLGFVVLFVRNVFKARAELGSEIELAPNRKEYFPDEVLEGEKLDRSLSFALVLLLLLGITLPFYWIAEPGRQAGAIDAYNASFESRGEGTYLEGAQCVNCHAAGGVGGTAPYVLLDADGQFLDNANWKAPALNNVLLRYSEEEVRYILNFGRPGSPMAAWGTPGGGPLTSQQVDNTIIYLRTLQEQSLDPIEIAEAGPADEPTSLNMDDDESREAQLAADAITAEITEEVERSIADGEFETVGEAVFNLGLVSNYDGGALACARCHTAGWSLGLDTSPNVLEEGIAACGGGNPSGIGFNLCGGSVKQHFPDDTWLRPDGSWYPQPGVSTYDGSYVEAMDGTRIDLIEGVPVDDSGDPFLILSAAQDNEDQAGDLAACSYQSGLWSSDSGIYPFDSATPPVPDPADPSSFLDPEPQTIDQVPGEGVMELSDGTFVSGCEIIEMPPRTSVAQFDFIMSGAEAGKGYGEGGFSSGGMMPGFGRSLPPEYVQAVVDYTRGS